MQRNWVFALALVGVLAAIDPASGCKHLFCGCPQAHSPLQLTLPLGLPPHAFGGGGHGYGPGLGLGLGPAALGLGPAGLGGGLGLGLGLGLGGGLGLGLGGANLCKLCGGYNKNHHYGHSGYSCKCAPRKHHYYDDY